MSEEEMEMKSMRLKDFLSIDEATGDGTTTTTKKTKKKKKRKKNGHCESSLKFVHILKWLPYYNKFRATSDLIAGITIGLTMIPQSIAYAALAGLTAEYGLYSSFVGGFVYVIFGTIKEVSIGPTSLMSLLTMEYTRDMPIEFTILLTFLAGCVELLMGLLNLGCLVDFISIPVTSAFTSAASIIIIIAQVQGLLGLRYKSYNIADNVYKAFKNIKDIRWADVTLSCCSIAFLLAFRKLKDIAERDDGRKKSRTKKILWFLSIARNALIVLITSIISYHLERHGSQSVRFTLSGTVKAGLPDISLPPLSAQVANRTYSFVEMCGHYGSGIFMVPLVAVLTNVAIAKAFLKNDSVDATQEMLTLGISNITASFFSSMPICGAFTRSAVSSGSGVQTPLSGVYTGCMTLLALTYLTPYFYFIPRATLAAVLVTAVLFMIDFRMFVLLWKGSKKDAIVAAATFAICIVYNIEFGLLFGILLNVIFLLRPSARPKLQMKECKSNSGCRYFMLEADGGLYYPAADYFYGKIQKVANKCRMMNAPLLVNCERFNDFDYTAVKNIERLSMLLSNNGHKLWLLNVKSEMIKRIATLANERNFFFIDDYKKIDDYLRFEKQVNDVQVLVDEEVKLNNVTNETNVKSEIEEGWKGDAPEE